MSEIKPGTNCHTCRFDWRDSTNSPRCGIIDGDGDPETAEAVEEWVADDDNVNHLGFATLNAAGCPGWQAREGIEDTPIGKGGISPVQAAVAYLTHAAQTDGAHHKQHDVVEALKVLLSAEDYAALGIVDEGVPS